MEASTRSQSSAVPHPAGDVTPDRDSSIKNESAERELHGVTLRVVLICLALAVAFGYVIPIIDVKMKNTFLGAQHFPPGAIAVLLVFLLIVNPAQRLIAAVSSLRVPLLLVGAGLSGLSWLSWRAGTSSAWFYGALALLAFVIFFLGRNPLKRNELLTIYITCLFSCLVPGHGSENMFITSIIAPFYFATAENKWLTFLNEHLPSWFSPAFQGGSYVPGSPGYEAIQGWYVGTGGVVPWGVWLVPLVAWSVLVFVSYFMLACLSVIVRAQWSDREALAFPLLRLPLEMTEDVNRTDQLGVLGGFFRNPLVWVGAGIGIFIQLMRGLNVYYPDVPSIPLEINGNYFSEVPWNQMGWISFQVYPLMIGIAYLLTSEVSFSLGFFYWFMKFQLVAAYYLGFMPDTLPGMIGSTSGAKIFTGMQHVGAYFGYVAIVVWTGREHFKYVAKRAFGREKMTDVERNEALSYPVAFWGFMLSLAFIIGWSTFAGMNPLVALLLWSVYLVISVALTRLIVEGGLLFVQQGWTPLGTLAQLINSGPGTILGPSSLVPGAFLQGSLMTDMRAFLLPSFVQSFKLAHDRKISMKPLLALIFAVIAITLVMSSWMNVSLGYQQGGLALEGWFAQGGAKQPASNANDLIAGAQNVNIGNWFWLAVGILMTYGMTVARSRFLWFPLHPLGFLLALTYPIQRLWFSAILGWAAKGLITRFGGSDTYRKTTPLFLGLILGDVLMMLIWLVVDAYTGRTGHQLMPG